jgi:hypothetical protein
MRFPGYLSLILLLLISASSCITPRKVASNFVANRSGINVLVVPPTGIFLNYYPANPDHLEETNDFMLEESQFLYDLDELYLLDTYYRALVKELRNHRINVFTIENINDFFELDSIAFVFSIAQAQLMEYTDDQTEYFFFNDSTVYEASNQITTLVFNTWIEHSRLNCTDNKMKVLFSMQHRSDYLEGRFRVNWWKGEVTYEYIPYRLVAEDVFDLAIIAGYRNAQYIFTYLLNDHVHERLPNRKKPKYFQYDTGRKLLRRLNTPDYGFIEFE